MKSRRGLALLLAAVLAACARETGYERAGDPAWGPATGYRDQRIGPDEYSIVVLGAAGTGGKRVAEIALLRAAAIAREQGRAGFVVTSTANQALAGHRPVSIFLPTPVGVLPIAVGETETRQPRAILVVRLVAAGAPLPPDGVAADRVIAELGPQVPGFGP